MTSRPGLPPGLPTRLAAALEWRHGGVVAKATGRVLEVPWISGEHLSIESWLEQQAAAGERYDTVISVVRTPVVADMARFVTAISELMTPEGQVLMVEPAVPPTRPGRDFVTGAGRVASRGRRALGTRLSRCDRSGLRRAGELLMKADPVPDHTKPTGSDRDVVQALWSHGLVVTDIARFSVVGAPVTWRRLVDLRARRPTPLTEQTPSDGGL